MLKFGSDRINKTKLKFCFVMALYQFELTIILAMKGMVKKYS